LQGRTACDPNVALIFDTDTTTLSGFEASAGTESQEQRAKNRVTTLGVGLRPVLESLHNFHPK